MLGFRDTQQRVSISGTAKVEQQREPGSVCGVIHSVAWKAPKQQTMVYSQPAGLVLLMKWHTSSRFNRRCRLGSHQGIKFKREACSPGNV